MARSRASTSRGSWPTRAIRGWADRCHRSRQRTGTRHRQRQGFHPVQRARGRELVQAGPSELTDANERTPKAGPNLPNLRPILQEPISYAPSGRVVQAPDGPSLRAFPLAGIPACRHSRLWAFPVSQGVYEIGSSFRDLLWRRCPAAGWASSTVAAPRRWLSRIAVLGGDRSGANGAHHPRSVERSAAQHHVSAHGLVERPICVRPILHQTTNP